MVSCFLTPVDRVAVHVPAGAAQRGRGRRRRVPLRLHRVPHRGQGRPAPADLRDDRQALQARRPPAEHEAVGPLRDGRDGHRPHPPRLLEGHGPRAPQARAGRRLRERDPRLPRPRRRAAREPAAPRRRRDGRAGRLGSRRQAHGRRHPHQRVAAPGGPARPRARARGPLEHARLRHRLVAHEGLGRGRLLLPRLPQRRGPRAERDDPRGRLRALPRRARASASARSRTSWATRSRRRCSAPRTSTPRSRASRPT